MKKRIHLSLVLSTVFLLTSCFQNPGSDSKLANDILRNITGAAGEILIVLDNTLWKGEIGNILRETFEQEYPSLPQPEPLFDVIHIPQGAFDNMFRTHRTIILADISPEIESNKITYSQDRWARPQLIINIYASDNQSFIKLLQDFGERLVNKILNEDRKRIAEVFKSSKDLNIKNSLAKLHVNLAIPRGYNIDVNTDEFMLLSVETPRSSQNLIIYHYPYLGEKNLLTKSLIDKRDEFLMKYTVGTRANSYMTTTTIIPPLAYDLNKGDKKYIEIRGLWELHNGYMGGPFISHTALDETRKEIITVEGYVYNPGDKKRNLMRQIEAIVYSFEIIE